MTLHERITSARKRFEAAGIDPVEAAVDAEWLARTALGWDRARLLASSREPAPPGFAAAYEPLVVRREHREPVAYIVGHREFWQHDFEVGPGVLVPRPETEIIVEEAVRQLAGRKPLGMLGDRSLLVADVGTGSGCLAIALALEFPRARLVATDTSPAALVFARRNAERHEVAGRIDFVLTSMLAGIDTAFDLVVSNPPYVPASDLPGLPPEVREYEPREALVAGTDGLDAVRDLIVQAESRLHDGGLLIFEFGFGQAAGIEAAVAARPAFRLEAIRRDLQGIPRTAVARFAPNRSSLTPDP